MIKNLGRVKKLLTLSRENDFIINKAVREIIKRDDKADMRVR